MMGLVRLCQGNHDKYLSLSKNTVFDMCFIATDWHIRQLEQTNSAKLS